MKNKSVKRLIVSVLCAAMTAAVLAGCGSSSSTSSSSTGSSSTESSAADSSSAAETAEVPTVTIWGNGGQEVRDALQTIADMYNADPEYNTKAKVEVQFVVSGTNEQSLADRLAAAYQAGETDTDFDLIALDDSGVSQIIAQTADDFFETIDTSKLANYDNLVYKENVVGDTFIPYRGTAVFLAYNSDAVENPPTTDEELYQWIKDNPGRFCYCDPSTGGSGYSFVANTIYNQLPEEAATSADTTWETDHTEEWDSAYELLAELHPYLYQTAGKVQYAIKNQGTLDLLATNEIDMCPAFANMVLTQKSMGTLPDSIKLTQIEPSFMGALAGFCIPTIAKDKEAALSVIDYFLSYEAQAADWNAMYASPVVDTTKLEGLNNADWLEEVNLDSLRYLAIGDIATDIRSRWTDEIGILAQ